ncbi:MAG: hypothetical protein GX282_07785 [Campylobacteraceae bacterium]|nr:hypothetical protein [Campylobacteraceae bacterium]
MKIEEITKKIIEELKLANESVEFDGIETGFSDKYAVDSGEDFTTNEVKNEAAFKTIEEIKQDEIEFLTLIKERVLVLFEGLNNFERGDIEARVELNLKFMEFLLANIEKRVEDLSK